MIVIILGMAARLVYNGICKIAPTQETGLRKNTAFHINIQGIPRANRFTKIWFGPQNMLANSFGMANSQVDALESSACIMALPVRVPIWLLDFIMSQPDICKDISVQPLLSKTTSLPLSGSKRVAYLVYSGVFL